MTVEGARARLPDTVGAALAAAAVGVALVYAPALASPFVAPKLAVLVLAGAVGLFGWTVAPRDDPTAGAFGALLLLSAALAGARRAPGAPYATRELVRVGAAFGVALGAGLAARADGGNSRRLFEAVTASAALVALLGLLQHLRLSPLPIPTISVPGSTFGNRNIAAEAVAMAIPFGLGLVPFSGAAPRPRLVALASALLLELAFLAVARARGAWLGGALGLAVFFAIRRPRLPRPAIAAAVAVAAIVVLAATVPGRWTAHDQRDTKRFEPISRLVHDAIDPSSPVAHTRLALWRRTLTMFRAHPWMGIGPGNFRVLFPRYAEPGATADGVLSPIAVPRRAHNDLLERLVESGPFALVAWLALYAALGAVALRRAHQARGAGCGDEAGPPAACAGALAAFFGCGLTAFPFAMPGTLFLFAVAAGGLAAGGEREPDAAAPARRRVPLAAAALLGVAALVGAGWWSAHRLAASYWLARGEAAVEVGGTAGAARALASLARAAAADPTDFLVALRTSSVAAQAGHPDAAVEAARRALAIEPYSANAWEALARGRLDADDARGARDAADRALEILHDYPGARVTRARALARLAAPPGHSR